MPEVGKAASYKSQDKIEVLSHFRSLTKVH